MNIKACTFKIGTEVWILGKNDFTMSVKVQKFGTQLFSGQDSKLFLIERTMKRMF